MTPGVRGARGRLGRLAATLRRQDLGGVVVVAESARDPDLAAFVGSVHLGAAFLLVPAAGEPRLGYLTAMERREAESVGLELLRPEDLGVAGLAAEHGDGPPFWAAVLESAFVASGLRPCRVGLAGRFPPGILHPACVELESRGWRFVDGDPLLLGCRRRKTGRELESARAAAAGACEALRRVAAVLAAAEPAGERLLVAGKALTAGYLRAAIAAALAEHGLEQPEGNIVASGAVAAAPHSQGDSTQELVPGAAIVVDLFPRGAMFADCTRTFCRGEPSGDVAAAHAATVEGLRLARESAVPGVSGWELQRSVCEHFAEAGYPTPVDTPGTTVGYVHGLGHGVGYQLHELPSFRRGAGESGVLEEGDLFTLEPGLYDEPRGFGIRVEDLCHLGPQGLEVLTPLPYALDPVDWVS